MLIFSHFPGPTSMPFNLCHEYVPWELSTYTLPSLLLLTSPRGHLGIFVGIHLRESWAYVQLRGPLFYFFRWRLQPTECTEVSDAGPSNYHRIEQKPDKLHPLCWHRNRWRTGIKLLIGVASVDVFGPTQTHKRIQSSWNVTACCENEARIKRSCNSRSCSPKDA